MPRRHRTNRQHAQARFARALARKPAPPWTIADNYRLLVKACQPGGKLHDSMRVFQQQMVAASGALKRFGELTEINRRVQMAQLLYGIDGVALIRRARERAKTTGVTTLQAVEAEIAAVRAASNPYPPVAEFGFMRRAAQAVREGEEFDRMMKRTAATIARPASGRVSSISRHEPASNDLNDSAHLDPRADHSARRSVRNDPAG